MVSAENRQLAAQLLLDFYKGRLTNDELANRWPDPEDDAALRYIDFAVWGIYDDLNEHYFDEKSRRDYRTAKYIHRILCFLNSRFEYEWIGFPLSSLERVLEWFSTNRRMRNSGGDVRVWPFYRRADYVESARGEMSA
jgi:hypothetical protein